MFVNIILSILLQLFPILCSPNENDNIKFNGTPFSIEPENTKKQDDTSIDILFYGIDENSGLATFLLNDIDIIIKQNVDGIYIYTDNKGVEHTINIVSFNDEIAEIQFDSKDFILKKHQLRFPRKLKEIRFLGVSFVNDKINVLDILGDIIPLQENEIIILDKDYNIQSILISEGTSTTEFVDNGCTIIEVISCNKSRITLKFTCSYGFLSETVEFNRTPYNDMYDGIYIDYIGLNANNLPIFKIRNIEQDLNFNKKGILIINESKCTLITFQDLNISELQKSGNIIIIPKFYSPNFVSMFIIWPFFSGFEERVIKIKQQAISNIK